MAEYKYRLKNWILLRDIMSGNTILAEQVINTALNVLEELLIHVSRWI